MKIYILTFNRVESALGMITSSYLSNKIETKKEYYLNEEKAKSRQKSVYESYVNITGSMSGFECVLSEVDVVE